MRFFLKFGTEYRKTVALKIFVSKQKMIFIIDLDHNCSMLFPLTMRETMWPSNLSVLNLNIKVSTGRTFQKPPALSLSAKLLTKNVRCDPESSETSFSSFSHQTQTDRVIKY